MSEGKKTSKAKLGNLTPRDLELAGLVFQCFEGGGLPKINMDKFADLAGFKNAQSASACWFPVKKKLMALGDAAAKGGDAAANGATENGGEQDGGGTVGLVRASAPAPKATRKRKTKAEKEAENGGEAPAPKKARATKKAVKAEEALVKKEEQEEEEEAGDDGGHIHDEMKLEQGEQVDQDMDNGV